MKTKMTKFKEQFADYREKSGLSYRALERATRIKYSALAAMHAGRRSVSEQSARRIASAFGLSGEALEAFVLSALGTSKNKVLASVKDYPAEVQNALGLLLLANGVKAKQITGCYPDASTPDGVQNGVRLSLRGGRTACLHVALVWGA